MLYLYSFLMVLSRAQSTEWSMGLIIIGMDRRPIAVVVHLLLMSDSEVCLRRRYKDIAHILFIVRPGTATEANSCHKRVSPPATTILFVLSGSDVGVVCQCNE